MRRNHNPLVALLALLLLALILTWVCTSCTTEAEAATEARFSVEWIDHNLKIITDNETGVQYLAYVYSVNAYSAGCGLTKLEATP